MVLLACGGEVGAGGSVRGFSVGDWIGDVAIATHGVVPLLRKRVRSEGEVGSEVMWLTDSWPGTRIEGSSSSSTEPSGGR